MVLNGKNLLFNGKVEALSLKDFLQSLKTLRNKNFSNFCENKYFKKDDINIWILTVLLILLAVNLVLILYFIFVYYRAKKKRRAGLNETGDNVYEKLYKL